MGLGLLILVTQSLRISPEALGYKFWEVGIFFFIYLFKNRVVNYGSNLLFGDTKSSSNRCQIVVMFEECQKCNSVDRN